MRDFRDFAPDKLRHIVEREYLERFFQYDENVSVLAEGSVSYLYAPERLEPAAQMWPKAKFIICARNPLQMVPSLHQRHYVNGDETVREFDRAWALVPERRNGRSIPRSCLDARFLDYWEAGFLGKHVERFLRLLGRDRCQIILFDDIVADPRREYLRALDFLGLADDHKSVFERHADSKDCRIAWLQRLLQRPPQIAMHFVDSDDLQNPRFAESAGPIFQKILNFRSRVLDWNEIPARQPQVGPAVIHEMRAMYRTDVALLSSLIGRDLSHWLDTGEPTIVPIGARRGEKQFALSS